MNDVPLREYLEALIHEKDVRDQQRFDAQEEAVRSALAAQSRVVALMVSLVTVAVAIVSVAVLVSR